jgi:hypothetical protein
MRPIAYDLAGEVSDPFVLKGDASCWTSCEEVAFDGLSRQCVSLLALRLASDLFVPAATALSFVEFAGKVADGLRSAVMSDKVRPAFSPSGPH